MASERHVVVSLLHGGRCSRPAWVVAATLLWAHLGPIAPASAQPAGEAVATWKDVEASPQFKEVTAALKGGGPFSDAAREFLATVILPQFDVEENLPTLDDVRKKIRDRLLLVIGSNDSFEQASGFVRDSLDKVARDTNGDPLLRVNAMLFIGEMTDKGRIPWPAALKTLAAAAQDTALDPAVRIAAVVGLGNHLSAVARLPADQATAVRTTLAATLPSLLPPPANDPGGGLMLRSPAAAWLAARGLGLLPQAMNPVPPDIAAQLVAVIDDASWPFDVRVRAVATLGKTAGRESGVVPEPLVESIRKLAIAALDADRLEAQRLVELQSFKAGVGAGVGAGGGGGLRGPMPGMMGIEGEQIAEDGLTTAVCRRAAWRLYTLGDAIVPDSKKAGLAALLEKDAGGAQQLAALLKEMGEALDVEPYGYVFLKALDDLDPAGAKKRATQAAREGSPEQPVDNTPAAPAAPGDNKPAPKPNDSPFGASPF